MHTEYDFEDDEQDRVVYVRAIDVADLPDEVQETAEGATELYAVCTEDGERLAVVKERRLAFILARQNDFSPVSAH